MYDHKKIENKWKKIYEERKPFKCDVFDFSKPKYYALSMFPYPSAQGLHVGHPEGYTACDIVSRMKRMQGYNVLQPMGWDSFGLPAEQYAIKMNKHPEEFTNKNIDNFREQIKNLGFSYDWDRELKTSDPSYYKWTQWIFIQLFKNDLAYVDYKPVNFCPELGTVLANEEVIDGKSERGGFPVIRKPMRQWVLGITKYADKLLEDIDSLDWPTSTIEMQKNWIGRSAGSIVTFKINQKDELYFDVFTTRVDTLFGCSYVCLAPEHPLVSKITNSINEEAVKEYIALSQRKNDLERTELNKDKTGVFTGSFAINPINRKLVPIFVADYVLASYGSGAVMAVPAHDQRDYEFAKKYKLDMIPVLEGDISSCAYEGDGKHINSKFANGMNIDEAKKAILNRLIELKAGRSKVNYKLRDWLFSRQRYWGEPIPMYNLSNGDVLPINEKELPLVLPELDEYKPSGNGESPLYNATNWVNTTFNGIKVKRETNTMPQWAGSCWYYIRYIDPHNDNMLANVKLLNHWLPVDLYIGGAEHSVLHLLYARFWHKFLYDLNIVNSKEPFKKLFHQGMILGENGEKMSKSRGNVVNPDDIVISHGADTLRLYEMFMGPLEASLPWNENGLDGARKFIDRVYRMYYDQSFIDKYTYTNDSSLDYSFNYLVKKVTNDFNNLQFNTAISQMMIFVNDVYKANKIYVPYLVDFIKMFSCICPFVSEEIYEHLGNKDTITFASWPKFDENKLIKDTIIIACQVLGKLRGTLEITSNMSEDEIKAKALEIPNVKAHIDSKTVVKIIYVKNKIINIVVK